MKIAAGTVLGPYEILTPIGAGGMGEVYQAHDTRLDREVAIKVLPVEFATDADRLRRFEQEARATSTLNHPNILTIHDIGNHEGSPYLVSELLEGAELRAQLQDGALPARTVIDYAQQIASGLAAAHAKGIVHRDLKPENLFITSDGRVKILDFGLAKLKPSQVSGVDSQSPTQKKITDPGTVMGTVGYMSPEQVRGQDVDHRSDIFSFGVILYEMLSGRRAFSGESAIEVMNAILKEDPPELTASNPRAPQGLERLIRPCLEKQPERRFHSVHDLGYALDALSTSSGGRLETATALTTAAERTDKSRVLRREWLGWAVAVVLSLVTLVVIWAYFTRQPARDVRVFKTSILPPEKSSFAQIAVSPDGRHLAFTTATGGKIELWVRAFDSTEARLLASTQDARVPFWSPDSRFIGFFADGRLKKIEVKGGPVQPLCDVVVPFGGAWSRNGVILFGRAGDGLLRISESGGEVTGVTTPDKSRQEGMHHYPTFLPDGRHFLYSIQSRQKETRGVYIGSLDGTLKQRLLDDVSVIKYIAADPGETAGGPGWLVFGRDDTLLARPFDTSRLDFTGEPFTISDKVGRDVIASNNPTFSVSDDGVLVYDPGLKRQRRQYLWKDRHGQRTSPFEVDAGPGHPWLSPDEKRFIADLIDPQFRTSELWVYGVSGGIRTRFTFDPATDFAPVWAPNGSSIVWTSNRDGVSGLYQRAANGAGVETLLLNSDQPISPTDWSRNGHVIIYRQIDQKTKLDVWVLPEPGSGKEKPFLQTKDNETAGTLSPNGRWMAYASDETGKFEVYVQRFPGGGGKRQVSNGGGNYPRWRGDGRELFYYSRDGKLMAAEVTSGESFDVGAVNSLFEFRAGSLTLTFAPYAVTADGKRFLINEVVETEPNAPLTVVTNWTAGAKK